MALRRGTRNSTLLHELIRKQGYQASDYTLFFTSGEGLALPDRTPGGDVEERSGYLLDREGRVFFYWLGWDERAQAPGLIIWEEQQPEASWSDWPEYQRARERLGLAAAHVRPASGSSTPAPAQPRCDDRAGPTATSGQRRRAERP
jgi:hypothetical protein